MATRQTQYAESLGESTTTSTTYQDKTTLTFTPDASSVYYFLHSCLLQQSSSTSDDIKYRLQDTTGSTTFTEINVETKATTDYFSAFGMHKYTASGSPASTSFKSQFCAEQSGDTCKIKESTVLAIKHASGDEFGSSDTEATTTSSTYQDKTTLTFTPATTGDYLVIAYAEIQCAVASQAVQVTLDISGTEYGTHTKFAKDATSYYPWMTAVRVNLSNSSKTLKVKYKSPSAAWTCKIRNARILCIRLDTLDNNYYAEALTRTTTTSTTYQDKTTLTQTPQAKEHVIIGTGLIDNNSSSQDGFIQLLEGSTSHGVNSTEALGSELSTNSTRPYFAVYRSTLAASSTTWKTQFKTETSSTVGIDESIIAVLQTEATGAPAPSPSPTGFFHCY